MKSLNPHKQDKRVLLIDDDKAFRRTVGRLLQTKGFEVLEAEDGDAGVSEALKHIPDLILCDVQMPKMDGHTVLSNLRTHETTLGIPFIFMTSHGDGNKLRQGMEEGADDYLLKPFSMDMLLRAVEARLRKHEKIQRELEKTRQSLVAILEATTDLVVMLDGKDHAVTYLNEAGRSLLGIDDDKELSQVHFADFYEESQRPELIDSKISQAIRLGHYSGECVLKSRQGQTISALETIVAHKSENQELQFLSAIIRDITERRQVEQELEQSKTFLNTILNSLPISIFIKDAKKLRFVHRNMVGEQLTGLSLEESIGKSDFDLHPKNFAEAYTRADRDVLEGKKIVIREEEVVTRDKGIRLIRTSKVPILNSEDQPEFLLGISEDITEKKKMEVQLRQAQKLEAVGQLAAGIAHEINTPTQYINDNVSFLKDAFEDLTQVLRSYERLYDGARQNTLNEALLDEINSAREDADLEFLGEEIPKALEQSLEGLGHISKIVRAMKEFSHPGQEEKVSVDLNRALETTITVARNEWKYVADMVTDFQMDLPSVPCLTGEINQVILNLIVNAAHAIADVDDDGANGKGTITVSTRRRDPWVEVHIQDSGSGIPESIRDRILEPFFTTKEVGKGTGQGLAIAHSVIVDKHGGELTFESKMGRGTTFIIRLPISPPTATAEPRK